MRKRSRKACALLLSTAMFVSLLPCNEAAITSANEAEPALYDAEDNSGKTKAAAMHTKRTEVAVTDDFSNGLESSWSDAAGIVKAENGMLKMENNGGTVSSIKRDVGNNDFTVDIHWKDYSADTNGNNSVFIMRVSDGTENNLAEIQYFSNGDLKLLLKSNDEEILNQAAVNNYSAKEGWFKLGYNSENESIIAEYKSAGDANYTKMTGDGTKMETFGGAHVAEFRAQKWGGTSPLSVNIDEFTTTFVKETQYKYSEQDEFTALGDFWYDATDDITVNNGLVMANTGNVSTVKRNIGDRDYSVEAKWSDFTSGNNGKAAMRIPLDSSDKNYIELSRQKDDKIHFTIMEDGTSVENTVDYTGTEGWFRLDYDTVSKAADAFYKAGDGDTYQQMPGSGRLVNGYDGNHTLEFICDGESSGITVNKADLMYNESTNTRLASDVFNVLIDENTGGIYELSNPSDEYGTNYVMNPDIHKAYDIDDSRWVGDIQFNVKTDGGYHAANTSLSDDVREITREGDTVKVNYQEKSGNQYGIKDFALTESYQLNEAGDQLNWLIDIDNTSGKELEIADLSLSFLMNSWWNTTQDGIYEQNVARHSYVAEDGSYIYWQRPNGDGSFLVMIPQDGTSLEFKTKANDGPFGEADPSWEGLVEYCIHSKKISKTNSGKYLPETSLIMGEGEHKQYGFTFRWAQNYSDLRDVLYDAGIVDAVSLPGMVIPKDMKATLALRCKEDITDVTGEDRSIKIEEKETKNGYQIYEITFTEFGSKKVTVHYGNNKKSVLQYYSTESVENLVNANTEFIVNKQQAKTAKGYDGAYLQWDMSRSELLTWENQHGGWAGWMYGGSDDLGLAPAVYLSEKNITSPEKYQIESLEYYLKNFIWGYMQQHDTYKIYRWYDGQDGTPYDKGTWRSYNYVHVANTYYNMYQIAKNYPNMTDYLTADEYLLRCYNTLKAYFTYNMFDGTAGTDTVNGQNGKGAYKFGNMGEMNLPGIVNALEAEGHTEEQEYLLDRMKDKADNYIFATKYPFASEMSIDTTGFETCYTLGKFYDNRELIEKVTKASMACRGLQPLWYFYGSDNRHMGESWWNLGYETQLGAWQQQDYLYTYLDTSDEEFDDIMRGTYGAYLAGWANINVGQISSDADNYGASSWQFQSEGSMNGYSKHGWIPNINGWWAWSGESCLGFWGGLKTASANVVDDDIVGLYGYGCDLSVADDGTYTIIPKDGVRTRLALYNKDKFAMEINKARYRSAEISDNLSDIKLELENVTGKAYQADVIFKNLPAGTYNVLADGEIVSGFTSDKDITTVSVDMPRGDTYIIEIKPEEQPEENADKTALQKALDDGNAIKADGYTEDSYAALTNALAEGQKVLDNADASQAEVNEAEGAIRAAIDGLVKQDKPDKPDVPEGYKVIISEGAEEAARDKHVTAALDKETVNKDSEAKLILTPEKGYRIKSAVITKKEDTCTVSGWERGANGVYIINLSKFTGDTEITNISLDISEVTVYEHGTDTSVNIGAANISETTFTDEEAGRIASAVTNEDCINTVIEINSGKELACDAKSEAVKKVSDAIESGRNVEMFIEVKEETGGIGETNENDVKDILEKEAVKDAEDKTGGKAVSSKIAMPLDISLFAKVEGTGVKIRLKDTNTKKIVIKMGIPSRIAKEAEGITRSYYVVRFHEGKKSNISCKYDKAANTIKFESDKFSTYVLCYVDTKKPSDNGNGGGVVIAPYPVITPSPAPEVATPAPGTPSGTGAPVVTCAPSVTTPAPGENPSCTVTATPVPELPSHTPAATPGIPEATKTPGSTQNPSSDTRITVKNAIYRLVSSGSKETAVFSGIKKNIKKVVIPASVKSGNKTYKVTSIANNAFKGNKKITQVTIGANIKKIGKNAFKGCSSLKKITIKSKKLKMKNTGKAAFKGINKKAVIKVPKGRVKSYRKIVKARGAGKKAKVIK